MLDLPIHIYFKLIYLLNGSNFIYMVQYLLFILNHGYKVCTEY